jgi:hypothetical protein
MSPVSEPTSPVSGVEWWIDTLKKLKASRNPAGHKITHGGIMEITKGQVVKVTTTKDKCIRITVDIEQAFVPANVNILQWQDTMITIQHEDE